jgi:hypothetical protein
MSIGLKEAYGIVLNFFQRTAVEGIRRPMITKVPNSLFPGAISTARRNTSSRITNVEHMLLNQRNSLKNRQAKNAVVEETRQHAPDQGTKPLVKQSFFNSPGNSGYSTRQSDPGTARPIERPRQPLVFESPAGLLEASAALTG